MMYQIGILSPRKPDNSGKTAGYAFYNHQPHCLRTQIYSRNLSDIDPVPELST